MTLALLSVQSLGVTIGGVTLLKDLCLEVGRGEIVGLVGASGSGKSMTALAILRLLPRGAQMSGTVTFAGRALSSQTATQMQQVRGRDIGMVFQEPMSALNPVMRVGQQVAETVRLHESGSRTAARARACAALESVGLSADRAMFDRYPHELSGGQRQRVAIAIAIAMRPSLLIADEPTTALDATTRTRVLELLSGLARSRSMGLILVSHDLALVEQVTDRVAVMHQGEIVEQGPTLATLRQPQTRHARALLAAARLAPRRAAAQTRSGVPVLEARDIVRDYPSARSWRRQTVFRAVDGVSLRVHAGETVGVVGESGCGKSSLLRILLALDVPQAGEVRLRGEPFSASTRNLRRLRRSIQAVFQDPYGSFDPRWTVARLISEPFFLLDVAPSARERRRRVDAALAQVGLRSADATRLAQEFSGGQRQRIAIARALIIEPAVIAFDEAVSALDVLVRAQVLDLLAELSQRLQLAYVFVSHDLKVVRAIADQVYVMQRGRIVEQGPTHRIFSSPQQPYTRTLLASVSTLHPVQRE